MATFADTRTRENRQDMMAAAPRRSAAELGEAARRHADSAPASAPTLATAGPVITVCWHGVAAPTAADWVGLYRRGAPDWDMVTWGYTNGQPSGCGYLTVTAGAVPGPYELRLFSNDSVNRLAVGDKLAVVDYASVGVGAIGPWQPGSNLHPYWEASYPLADLISLVAFGAPSASGVGDVYLDPQPSGSANLVVPAGTEPGEYELRLVTDQFLVLRATAHLTVDHPTARITHDRHHTDMAPLPAGSPLTVSWSGIPSPTATDWFGLFPLGATHHEHVSRAYTTGAGTGSRTLTVPATAKPGRYELRLFAANGHHPLACTYHTDDIEVGSGARLGNFPAFGFAACHSGKVVCGWQGVTTPTAHDWIGVYHAGAPSSDYLAWAYTGGGSFGTLHLPLPALPHGDYEVRLFRDNGYTLIAFDLLFL